MQVHRHPGNIRRMLVSRLKRVQATKPLLAASLATITKVCGNPSCHCHQGGDKHPAHHLTFKVRGKTHTVYVPFDFTEEVRSWIEEHRRLKRLLQEITQLSLALVRSHAQEQKRRHGRS
jgi:DNA-binding transcriptional regulator LsrR (DeoR family)